MRRGLRNDGANGAGERAGPGKDRTFRFRRRRRRVGNERASPRGFRQGSDVQFMRRKQRARAFQHVGERPLEQFEFDLRHGAFAAAARDAAFVQHRLDARAAGLDPLLLARDLADEGALEFLRQHGADLGARRIRRQKADMRRGLGDQRGPFPARQRRARRALERQFVRAARRAQPQRETAPPQARVRGVVIGANGRLRARRGAAQAGERLAQRRRRAGQLDLDFEAARRVGRHSAVSLADDERSVRRPDPPRRRHRLTSTAPAEPAQETPRAEGADSLGARASPPARFRKALPGRARASRPAILFPPGAAGAYDLGETCLHHG